MYSCPQNVLVAKCCCASCWFWIVSVIERKAQQGWFHGERSCMIMILKYLQRMMKSRCFCNCNPTCLSIGCCSDFWTSTHEPLWVSLKRRSYRVASSVSAPACEDLTPQHDGFLQVLSQVSNHVLLLGLLNFHQPEVDHLPHQVLRCFLTEVYPNTSQSSGGEANKSDSACWSLLCRAKGEMI